MSSTNKADRHDITEILLKSGVKHHIPIQIQLGGYINDVNFYMEK
jgi:hypothetical protein